MAAEAPTLDYTFRDEDETHAHTETLRVVGICAVGILLTLFMTVWSLTLYGSSAASLVGGQSWVTMGMAWACTAFGVAIYRYLMRRFIAS